MLPSVRTTESDGALGIRPSLSGLPLAIVGQCTSGTLDQPTSCTDPDQVKAIFGAGRAVEAACYALENFGRSVVVTRNATSVAALYGTVDDYDFDGTSTVTLDVDGSNKPNDDYEIMVNFSTSTGADGTIGSTSPAISLEVSCDAGRSFDAIQPLGTAAFYVIPDTNVKLQFGVGTVKDGDVIRVTVAAERANSTDLGSALDALQVTSLAYELVGVTDELDESTAGTCASFLAAMHAAGKHKDLMGGFRVQGIYAIDAGGADESDADYLTAFNDEFSAFASSSMYIAAGAAKTLSSVTRGRHYRRSPCFAVMAQLSAVSEEIDISALDYRLPGVTIRTAKGNPDPGYYDESVSPGLDDARALTLRSWDGETGVYVNNPRLISAVGSDFDFSPKRRVMNLARGIAVAWLRKFVISKPLRVNKATGKVRESELLALESALNSQLSNALLGKPKASSVRVVLSRSDAILQPPYPLTGKLRMVPLAYPKDVSLDAGWELSEPIVVEGAGG
jgi:hypothetical protein